MRKTGLIKLYSAKDKDKDNAPSKSNWKRFSKQVSSRKTRQTTKALIKKDDFDFPAVKFVQHFY